MEPLLVGYVGLYAGSAVACLASIPRARSIQHPGTRKGLIALLLSVGIWSAGYVGYLIAPTEPLKLGLYIIGFAFAFVAVGAWLYFCAAYTGRPPGDAPYRNVAIGVFLVFLVLKFLNPLHNLYFTAAWTTEPFPHLAIQHQLLYWVVLGLSYAVIAVGFFMLIERFYYTGTDSRPLVILVGLTGLPAIATILSGQIEGALPLMYEPPGVALFAVGTLFIYIRRFEAIRLTGGTDEPAIFLDADGRIRDYNQAARKIFPELQGSIGNPVDSVSASLAEQVSAKGVLTVSEDDDTRFYEVSSAPFMTGEVATGELVMISDVTERETYRRQLEEKTDQLETLNRVVRHDIRNDMAVILSWGEMLQDHVDEEGEEQLERVLRSSRHVIELTEIARDFVESFPEDESAELEPLELRPFLEDELARVRDNYENAVFRVPDGMPDVTVRANEMLSSVFRNLFQNAVQHTDEETPEITLSVEEQPDSVRIRVADNGPGIPDGQKSEIFGKGDKGLDSPGTGIGLYLVQTLVDQYEGEVWVEDNEPKGTVFIVELPKAD
jgi:signal transduction histidine kinase